MMEQSRYFDNPKSSQTAGSLSNSNWKKDKCSRIAQELLQKCLKKYNKNVADSESMGSLYSGALGPLVYLQYRMAIYVRKENPEASDRHMREALRLAKSAVKYQTKRARTAGDKPRVTLLESPYVGAKAILTAILVHTDQFNEAKQQADELVDYIDMSCREHLLTSECDVLYGRAGAIQAIIFLRCVLEDDLLGSDTVLHLAKGIIDEGTRLAAKHDDLGLPFVWELNDSKYLGAARGIVGIVHTLLMLNPEELDWLDQNAGQWNEDSNGGGSLQQGQVLISIHETIHKLDDFCWPSGNLERAIKEPQGTDTLVHWDHGAPGHILLLVRASEVFQEETFLRRARDIANGVVWKRGLLKEGVGLCHGIAGNAYGFLAIGRSDPQFIAKAEFFVDFCLDHLDQLESAPDRPYSLYGGLGGLVLLVMDLARRPAVAPGRFPLYDL